jgi:predicted metal-dependent hydrolase
MDNFTEFPLAYTIRRSLKARYLRIQLTHGKPVEMIYPRRSSRREAIQFLHSKLDWIMQQTAYLNSLNQAETIIPPPRINLPCINQSWDISHRITNQQRARIAVSHNHLTITTPNNCQKQAVDTLKRWLKRTAEQHLTPILNRLSEDTGLHYHNVKWRCQKTRWGSCNQNQVINLNTKLLFLNEEQVRYVLCHELCHTVHMRHDKHFWSLLSQHIPNAKTIDRELYQYPYAKLQWLHTT